MRLVIFFLRIAVGLNLFYLGFSTLFNPTLGKELGRKSLGDLYSWLSSPANIDWIHRAAPWAFIVIGICLAIGLATRLVSLLGILLVAMSLLPTLNSTRISALQIVNNEGVILILSLLVIFFGKAGLYFGLDRFFHFSLWSKK